MTVALDSGSVVVHKGAIPSVGSGPTPYYIALNVTVASNPDRTLLFKIALNQGNEWNAGVYPNPPTFNGVALTRKIKVDGLAGASCIWELVDPPVGTFELRYECTNPGGSDGIYTGEVYYGTDGVGNTGSGFTVSSASPVSASITVGTGGMASATGGMYAATFGAVGGSATLIDSTTRCFSSYQAAPVSAMSFTHNSAGGGQGSICVVELVAAAPADTTAPTVTGISSSTAAGSYNAGDAISIQVAFDEAVIVTGTPQLTVETGGTDRVVNYASGSGTNTLTFTYTVQAGDTSADLDYTGTTALALNSGTIQDAAGNNATLTLPTPGAAGSLGANEALVIDTTAPTITGPSGATGGTSAISVAENTTTIHTFTAGETVTWDLNGGADVALFAINSGTGALTFTSGRDFEAPSDADTNNTYVVGVRATDTAGNATTQTCTVTVTNVVEGGGLLPKIMQMLFN